MSINPEVYRRCDLDVCDAVWQARHNPNLRERRQTCFAPMWEFSSVVDSKPCYDCHHWHVKQLSSRVEESLAAAVKEHAALTGESVNAYITRLLGAAVGGRKAWKSEAITAGRLMSRASRPSPHPRATVSTAPGYASRLVSSERDER